MTSPEATLNGCIAVLVVAALGEDVAGVLFAHAQRVFLSASGEPTACADNMVRASLDPQKLDIIVSISRLDLLDRPIDLARLLPDHDGPLLTAATANKRGIQQDHALVSRWKGTGIGGNSARASWSVVRRTGDNQTAQGDGEEVTDAHDPFFLANTMTDKRYCLTSGMTVQRNS